LTGEHETFAYSAGFDEVAGRYRGIRAGRHVPPSDATSPALVVKAVRVTLEIDARLPSGVPDNVVRIVSGNGRTLKFESQWFEKE
jgi:hypothetical protein